MSLNEYNKIAELYNKSHTKPDKLYSTLPTILNLVKNCNNPKTITDLGCGDGFFTFPIAELFPDSEVIGIDNSSVQIDIANKNLRNSPYQNITFVEGDIFEDELPKSDIIVAPFVVGYCPKESLNTFLTNLKNTLNTNGLLIIILDDPQRIDNSKFGARKTINRDILNIELYDKNGEKLPTLHAFYHNPKLLLESLKNLGFDTIQTHTPMISEEGMDKYGKDWWSDYKNNSELCYVSCIKP